MNIAVRIALVVTTLICAICIYVITDYRGRLKTAELTVVSLKESASKTGPQSSSLEAVNQELEKKVELFKRETESLMGQLERAISVSKTAQGISREKERLLADRAKDLRLMKSERDKLMATAKNAQQLKKTLIAYQGLGTIAELQAFKDQVQKNNITSGELVEGSPLVDKGDKLKAKAGAQLGVILSVDTKLGFCVIDCGSIKGIEKGDEYHIHRAGSFVGKIKIEDVRPAVSIGTAIRKFTPKGLRAGDKVIQGQ